MTRNERYAAHIAEVVRTRYAQDVSLLVLYGSHRNGTEHPYSDVDLYFVPAGERAMQLCRTYLIEGVGYDLFPVDWDRLQRIRQAKEAFGDLCLAADPGRARGAAGHVMLLLSDACAYLNGRYFRFGLKRQLHDLGEMDALPEGFLADYRQVVSARTAPALRSACRHALAGTEALLRARAAEPAPALRAELLADMLRESISTFNKIRVCAQTGDAALAFISGVCLQGALEEMRREAGAPACELLSGFDAQDLCAFDRHAQAVLSTLVSAAEKGGAGLEPYAAMDDFIAAT